MGRLLGFVLAFIGLLLLPAQAQQQRRVALVLGNAAYEDSTPLANPVNDATDIAAKLREVGFEVIEGHDLGKRDLERKIGDFSDALAGANVGLFFYAGHGVQVQDRNYIIPVDARVNLPVTLRLEAIPMDEVLDIMEEQVGVSLVFLDACRNNPFLRSVNKRGHSRSAAPLRGLAQFDSSRGSFIGFSTAPGAVAADGTGGRNSPFAAALLKHMATPGQSVSDLMIEVRNDVVDATREMQRPFEQGSLLERFEFVPEGGPPVPAPAQSPKQPVVASLDRSVGDKTSVVNFLRDRYLIPDSASVAEAARTVYADHATILGRKRTNAELVADKAAWFAQWASWTLQLDTDSVTSRPLGEDRVDVVFDMSYSYVSKDKSVPVANGRSRVSLQLVMIDGQWRVAAEGFEIK